MEKIKFSKSDGYSVEATKDGKHLTYISKDFVCGGWKVPCTPTHRVIGALGYNYKYFNTLKEAKEYIINNN